MDRHKVQSGTLSAMLVVWPIGQATEEQAMKLGNNVLNVFEDTGHIVSKFLAWIALTKAT